VAKIREFGILFGISFYWYGMVVTTITYSWTNNS